MKSGVYFFEKVGLCDEVNKFAKKTISTRGENIYTLENKNHIEISDFVQGNEFDFLYIKNGSFKKMSVNFHSIDGSVQKIESDKYPFVVKNPFEKLAKVIIKFENFKNEQIQFGDIVFSKLIGSFKGVPIIQSSGSQEKISKKETLSGRYFVLKSKKPFEAALRFKDYPCTDEYIEDLVLLEKILSKDKFDFINYYKKISSNDLFFRNKMGINEPYNCTVTKISKMSFSKNIYLSGLNFSIELGEVA